MSLKQRSILYSSLALIFTAAFVVGCLFTAGNLARAEETGPLFYVESVFGAAGRQIEVPVKYEDISKMEGVEFILTYDPDILEPVDVIPNAALPFSSDGDDTTFQFDLDHSANSISVAAAFIGTDGVNEFYPPPSGEFCRVVFMMLQGGPSGTPEVTLLSLGNLVVSVIETIDGVDNIVDLDTCATGDGTVDVYEVVYGDTNMDNTINAQDARLALRYYLSLEQDPPTDYQTLAADVNGDGMVTAVDARLILRRYLNLEPLFPIEELD